MDVFGHHGNSDKSNDGNKEYAGVIYRYIQTLTFRHWSRKTIFQGQEKDATKNQEKDGINISLVWLEQ